MALHIGQQQQGDLFYGMIDSDNNQLQIARQPQGGIGVRIVTSDGEQTEWLVLPEDEMFAALSLARLSEVRLGELKTKTR